MGSVRYQGQGRSGSEIARWTPDPRAAERMGRSQRTIFAESGFAALATTSGGICRTFGLPDAEAIGRDQMLSVVRRIAHAVDVPVTADLMGDLARHPPRLLTPPARRSKPARSA